MPGNRVGKSSIVAGVEPGAARGIGRGDRSGHDVPRRQLAAGVGVEREAAPVPVHQHGARAAHRLGDERRGVDPGQLERGGMELEELEVAKLGADPVRQRPAVGGGHLRIGGDRVELAHAAGGEHDGAGAESDSRASPADSTATPAARPSCDQERGDLGVLQQLDQRMRADHLGEAADQRGAGPVAAGVDDPGPGVGRLEPEAEPPVGSAIEPSAQGEQLVNPVGAFACEDANGFGVGQPVTGGQGVGGVLAGAVAGAQGHRDAALGPGAGAVGERFLGDHDRRVALRRPAARRVQRPAMPVPTMTGRGKSWAEIYGGKAEGGKADERMSSRAKRGSSQRASRQPSRRSLASLGMTEQARSALPHVLTRTMSQSAARAKTMFGSHAATIGSTTPPAPTAFMIWVMSRKITVVPRLIAMPTAAPARGAW